MATTGGEFTLINSNDFHGRYLVIFFYPQDFTLICPTELIAFSEHVAQFYNNDCDLIGVSVDTKYSHAAWKTLPRSQGGISGLKIPLIADNQKQLAQKFGCYLPDQGITLRATYIIDSKNVLRSSVVNDLQVVNHQISLSIRFVGQNFSRTFFFEIREDLCLKS